jgi:F-type H+-transporting ATPase subunit gamma
MEMIAASKMRRVQERALAARPYAQKMREVLADLAAQPQTDDVINPLLERRPVKRMAIVHITADRGLCGGLNANMNRTTVNFLLEQKVPITLITVGRKGHDFMVRYGQEIRAYFTDLSDQPSLVDIIPIARILIDDYTDGLIDLAYLAFTRFITTTTQRPQLQQLLPVQPATIEKQYGVEYIYEPSSQAVLAELLPRFIETQVYEAILESIASEQSARMVAMRAASDNANEMIQELGLAYNKLRQETITKELLDITAGTVAKEQA